LRAISPLIIKRLWWRSTAELRVRRRLQPVRETGGCGMVMIELAGLEKIYRGHGADVEALRRIDLRVERGEIYGVIGRSGAGKSTLLRCINMLERPTAGTVRVDGVDLTALAPAALRERRRGIGMIFQHFALLSSRTVRENVALPLELAGRPRAEIANAVEPMLEFVGLEAMRDRYPAQLSGGQAQRVGIARALAGRPSVLLCDEATSALDPETTASILALLRDVNRTFGTTIVLITHEMGVIKEICDRVAVIDGGRIVESGRVRDIFLAPRAAITRTFVGEPDAAELSAMLGATLDEGAGGNAVWRLGFSESARESVVTALIRRFPLDLNIVSGTIERVGGEPLGTLVVELVADPPTQEDARRYLDSVGVRVDVLGYVERTLEPLT
jgi:D-methionine transport system ATP-binding protein